MSAEELEKYENEMELALYREYRDVVRLFSHVVETERRFYLCNSVDVKVRSDGGEVWFDVTMTDAFRQARPGRDVQGRQRGGVGQGRLRPAQERVLAPPSTGRPCGHPLSTDSLRPGTVPALPGDCGRHDPDALA